MPLSTSQTPIPVPLLDPEALPVVVAVAIDGSDSALTFAAAEAVALGARLHVLHVVGLAAAAPRDAREVVVRATRRARSAVDGAVEVTDEVFHGDVLDGLVMASRRARVLVLERQSARGRAPGRRLSARVASAAGSSVVSVPSGWDDEHAPSTGGSVTVGVREPLSCGPIVAEAVTVAAARGAHLLVLHVLDPGSTPDPEDEADLFRVVARVVDRSSAVHPPAVLVQTTVGDAALALAEASRTSGLVIVGRHRPRRPGAGSTLGAVARATLRDARCPVLVATPAHSVSSVESWFSGRFE